MFGKHDLNMHFYESDERTVFPQWLGIALQEGVADRNRDINYAQGNR